MIEKLIIFGSIYSIAGLIIGIWAELTKNWVSHITLSRKISTCLLWPIVLAAIIVYVCLKFNGEFDE
jgi:ABC-type antimicrobial peptide transport system permease subunit